jgi:hypothetical protein
MSDIETPSLLDLTRALATDDATKAAFREDPEGFLAERGWGDLAPDDLAVALGHVADALPVHLANALGDVADPGLGLLDQLAGVATIDPDQAQASWAELTADPADLDADAETDATAGGDESDELEAVTSDPDLDEGPDDAGAEGKAGGLDPADLDADATDLDDRAGGLDPADEGDLAAKGVFAKGAGAEPEPAANGNGFGRGRPDETDDTDHQILRDGEVGADEAFAFRDAEPDDGAFHEVQGAELHRDELDHDTAGCGFDEHVEPDDDAPSDLDG